MRKCKNCNEISDGKFCPNCGINMATNSKEIYPYEFHTYVHGHSSDNEDLIEMIENDLKIDPDSELARDIYGCDYEIKLNFIIHENETVELIGVDDRFFETKKTDE